MSLKVNSQMDQHQTVLSVMSNEKKTTCHTISNNNHSGVEAKIQSISSSNNNSDITLQTNTYTILEHNVMDQQMQIELLDLGDKTVTPDLRSDNLYYQSILVLKTKQAVTNTKKDHKQHERVKRCFGSTSEIGIKHKHKIRVAS